MTRTRNSAFGGTTPPDVDVDVPSYTSIVREIVQDANLLYDKMTGSNGIASDQIIAKNGYVASGTVKTGPPTRRPVMNQTLLPTRFADDTQSSVSLAESDYDLYGGRAYIIAVPFWVPLGETDFWIDLSMVDPFGSDPEYEVRDSSWALHQEGILTKAVAGFDPEVWQGVIQFATPGQYYLLIRATIGWEGNYLRHVRVYPKRTRSGAGSQYPTASYNPFPIGTTNGSAAAFETIHDEMIADNAPVAGWIMTTLNRNVNWLLEFVTGAPAPGNSETILSNSRHMRHKADVFADEGQIELVVMTEALGSVTIDRRFPINAAGTRGCLSYPPIIPLFYNTTKRTFHLWTGVLPNFSVANSLRCRVLAVWENKGDITQWSLGVNGSATTAFAQIGTSGFYVAEVSGISYTGETNNDLDLELVRTATGAGQHGEIAILGYQLYFKP
jgi:hypothetical protein